MKFSRFIRPVLILVVIFVMWGLLVACNNQPTPTLEAGSTPMPAPTEAPSAPAATAPPVQASVQPPTKAPTFTPRPAPEAIGIEPADISLDVGGLADTWQAVFVPNKPFDNLRAPGPSGLPAHIQILFDGPTDPWAREPGAPVIYIIPIEPYRRLWEENDSRLVSDVMRKIAGMSSQIPDPPPVRGLPVLPVEETFGVNDFATQLRAAKPVPRSASKNGFRFVGRFAQDATPLTNEWLRYIYQGLTNDGRYLVAFFFPVRTDALPDAIEEITPEEQQAFAQDGLGYLENKARSLDTLPGAEWEPDLDALDALIASLEISGVPGMGLMQGSWLWVSQRPTDAGNPTPVSDPLAYELTFREKATVQVRADCKSTEGTYAVNGGVAGTLDITLNLTTMQVCGATSQADVFLTALSQVERFAIAPGGHTMQLYLADGSTLSFSREE